MLFQAAATSLSAAVPVSDTGISTTIDALAHQAGLIAVTVYVLQFLKTTRFFPWLNANTETATRIVSTGAALAAALAVQISITGDAAHGWAFSGSIPSLHAIWDGAIRFFGQKMGQDFLYRKLVKNPQEVAVVAPASIDPSGKPIGGNA
jgi:hypothetical protein